MGDGNDPALFDPRADLPGLINAEVIDQ